MHPADAGEEQRSIIDACLARNVPFIWKGPGTLLVAGAGASEVVAELRSSGHAILGLEAFEVPSTEVRPRLDLIFDASLRPDVDDPSTVLDEWGQEIWVDIALRSGPESTR